MTSDRIWPAMNASTKFGGVCDVAGEARFVLGMAAHDESGTWADKAREYVSAIRAKLVEVEGELAKLPTKQEKAA
jgi:hypothetical protein